MENTKVKIDNSKMLGFAGILLMGLAAFLRHRGTDLFYQLNNAHYTPKLMTLDYPNPAHPIFRNLSRLFLPFAGDYLAPAFLLLLPGAVLLFISMAGNQKINSLFSFLYNRQKEKAFLAGLFILTAAVTLILYFTVLQSFIFVNDEFSYYFQANLIKNGRLFVPSPTHLNHFHYFNIINDGRMYSKYTNGWPALLSVGMLLGLPFVVNPLFSGGSVVLAYLAGKKLFGPVHGFLSAVLLLASPFFLFHGSSYWPHMSVGFFTLLTVLSLLNSAESPFPWLLIAGFSAGAILNIRPADGAVLTLCLIPLALYQWRKSSCGKKFGIELLSGAGVFLVMAGILLLCNRIQNNDPFVLGFTKHYADEKWGFHPGWHSPVKGFWNVVYSFMRSSFWTAPLLTPFLLLSVFSGSWKTRLLALPVAGFALFFFCYYSIGVVEFGARFYFAGFVLICLLVPKGVESAARYKCEKSRECFNAAAIAAVAACLIYFSGVAPVMFSRISSQYSYSNMLEDILKKPLAPGVKTLVFVKNLPDDSPVALRMRNLTPFSELPNLMAIFLTPEENSALIASYPHRQPMVLYFDGQKRSFVMQILKNDKVGPADMMMAGINYSKSVKDKDRAVDIFMRAHRMDPGNVGILFNLGLQYFEMEKYDLALPFFMKSSAPPSPLNDSLYFAARCAGEMGDKKTARENLSIFISKYPDSSKIDKARQWLIYYGGNP